MMNELTRWLRRSDGEPRQPVARKVVKSDAEWRAELSAKQYDVLRRKATELPFTGRYVDTKADGTYCCAACGAQLFDSETKFDSGTGWPSFTEPAETCSVELRRDLSHGMLRTEVICQQCGGHLGHVFNDGPLPGGQRYCINSASLELKPK
jgi:peptide-methionine (R)-S-oxide reductase